MLHKDGVKRESKFAATMGETDHQSSQKNIDVWDDRILPGVLQKERFLGIKESREQDG